MEPPRPVEELNSVVVAAIVVVEGGGHCGPQLGRAHGKTLNKILFSSLTLSTTKTLKQNLFFLLLLISFRALQNVFGCNRFWRKRIMRNGIFCDGVVIS
jgi:hypothetical protein